MNGSNQYHEPMGGPEERRSSVAAIASTSGLTRNNNNNNNNDTNSREQQPKKPLAALISGDHSANTTQPTTAPTSMQKQSFLSKFARSEVKSSKSIDKSAHLNKTSDSYGSSKAINKISTEQNSNNNNNNNYDSAASGSNNKPSVETEGDRGVGSKSVKSKGGLGSNLFPTRATKSFCESDTSEHTSTINESDSGRQQTILQSSRDTDINNNNNCSIKNNNNNNNDDDDDDDDDDDNQVLPAWPSRIDASTLEPSMVQVYSLKDYSQVSGPTENVASSTTSGRLMKSMSQDRKVDSRSKRMSECILSSMGHTGPFYPGALGDAKSSNQARQQRLPSMMGKISITNLSSMGPATSVNSLLPQGKNSTLINESRIDRMRKLFVSPLLLRGSTGSKSSSQPSHQVSNHSRLSLQAGANMLNKPHHLMHAMYRTRAGAHHSRRSPLRQKPGAIKGFRVYGCPLSMANTMYPITCFGRADIYKRQSVPYILARLCNYIEENSSQLTHEGIFRVSGNARLMEKLKTLFDHLGDAPLESECVDVATSASMLKMYLRELPDPLIPTRMNYYFFTLAKKYSSLLAKSSFNGFRASDNITATTSTIVNEASSISDGQSTLDRQKLALMRDLTKLIRKLPIENYNLLKYLACFLHRISLKQQSNKMSAEALGIVFGPNVFRIRSESYKGLKEQELSNQIMASIISNYKHIFDCELTDPLGNLVESDEFLNSNREREEPKERPHQVSEIDAAGRDEPTTSSGVSRKDGNKSSPATPSTSSTAYGSSNHHLHHYHPARCPKHGHRINYHYSEEANESEEGDANPDRDDDEDDSDGDGEDCEDDDGSYTRTSGSGSYCSSLASDTVESIYEGDVEGEQYDDEEDDEFGGLGSGSSSQCGSETSYTPSSSHTDSNTNEAELSSSNFGSVRSLNGPNGVDENEANSGEARKPCLVCKRRESQQIEANKIREQIPIPSTSGLSVKKSNILSDTTNDRHIPGHSANGENAQAEPQSSEQNQLADVKNRLRMSTRRKPNGDEAIKTSNLIKATKDDSSTKASAMTRSDFTLDSKSSSRQGAATNDGRPSRHGTRDQAKQTQKHSLIRRRSSSASSLFRVSKRRDHASQRRNAGKEDHHHAHRARIHSDRRKYHNDSRGYNRRSRNKSAASGRKNAHDPSKPGPSQQSGSGNKAAGGSSKTCPSWKKGDYYIPELLALNLSPETRDQLVWNYVSSSFLDVPECDRFCALRTYNSDETLLRTQECSTANSTEVASRARRRYSGQDYLNANQEDILANACSQFTQIFETYEDDNFLDVDVSSKNSKKNTRSSQQPCELGLSSTSAVVKSSVVSLLDDQMISFKHSSLSLSEDTSDPIVGQLKVIKDLVRALERLIKNGVARGISQEVSNFAFQLISDAGAEDRMDNIASCCIDHLVGLSITVTLENINRNSSSDQPTIDPVTQERLIALMSVKIADLKKRYNNLKYIREHYHKHHAKQHKEQLAGDKSARPTEADQELTNSNRSISQLHDRHSVCSDVSSLGSTSTTVENDCDNQASTTSQQNSQSRTTTISTATEAVAPIASCKFGSLCAVEFVFNIEKQLASRRISGCRFVSLSEMTLAQLQSEKLELQKNLLRYEHWFGRPTTRTEVNLVGHLYDRYRMVKIIKQRRESAE